jgi:D-sedoheptulose 7-phosphate isomerase
MDTQHFIQNYLNGFAQLVRTIDAQQLAAVGERVRAAYLAGSTLFVAGNGGSAAMASHAVADFSKTMLGRDIQPDMRRFRVISLGDNLPMLTAYANDLAFDQVFAQPLRNFAQPGDLLLVISSSGNSPNIVRALETARSFDMHTAGLLGFDGGAAKDLCDAALVVPCNHYGYVEDAHSVAIHLLTDMLKQALVRDAAVTVRS